MGGREGKRKGKGKKLLDQILRSKEKKIKTSTTNYLKMMLETLHTPKLHKTAKDLLKGKFTALHIFIIKLKRGGRGM